MSHFSLAYHPPTDYDQASFVFAFNDNKLLLQCDFQDNLYIPTWQNFHALDLPQRSQHYLGQLDGVDCFSVDLAMTGHWQATGWTWQSLRNASLSIAYEQFAIAGMAFQILHWDRIHQFCGRCAAPMQQASRERLKSCPRCGLNSYPRIAPAVIMLVYRENEILLSRSTRFPPNVYSVQAGFVEAGETLEQAVEREVMEEVGLRVKNIRYFSSQPWPFPNSLMVGFIAEYAGGELDIDYNELEDAAWFDQNTLPLLPNRISIAHRLISWFLEQKK